MMKIEELIKELKRILKNQQLRIEKEEMCGDLHDDHIEADQLLLKYIDNAEVTQIFDSIEKWYA